MAINVVREGWAWRQRAFALAVREIRAAPHLYQQTPVALAAWLLRAAGASRCEIAVWLETTERMIGVALDGLDDALASGAPEVNEVRRRLAALAEEMGEIITPETLAPCRTADIITFPRTKIERALVHCRAGTGGDAA